MARGSRRAGDGGVGGGWEGLRNRDGQDCQRSNVGTSERCNVLLTVAIRGQSRAAKRPGSRVMLHGRFSFLGNVGRRNWVRLAEMAALRESRVGQRESRGGVGSVREIGFVWQFHRLRRRGTQENETGMDRMSRIGTRAVGSDLSGGGHGPIPPYSLNSEASMSSTAVSGDASRHSPTVFVPKLPDGEIVCFREGRANGL